MWLSVVCILIDNDTGHHSRQELLWNASDTLTKREAAILKICPPAIITSAEGIIAKCDAIFGQWERENFYNHLSNYTKLKYWPLTDISINICLTLIDILFPFGWQLSSGNFWLMHVSGQSHQAIDQLVIECRLSVGWDVNRVSVEISMECQLSVDWVFFRLSINC